MPPPPVHAVAATAVNRKDARWRLTKAGRGIILVLGLLLFTSSLVFSWRAGHPLSSPSLSRASAVTASARALLQAWGGVSWEQQQQESDYFEPLSVTASAREPSGDAETGAAEAAAAVAEAPLEQEGSTPVSSVCDLPARDPGPCRGMFPKWTFDRSTGRCESFSWGGCDGPDGEEGRPANRFDSLAQCSAACETRSLAAAGAAALSSEKGLGMLGVDGDDGNTAIAPSSALEVTTLPPEAVPRVDDDKAGAGGGSSARAMATAAAFVAVATAAAVAFV